MKKVFRSKEEWHGIVAQFKASGLSLREFGEKNGIGVETLRRQVLLKGGKRKAPAKHAMVQPSGGFITISNGEVLNGHIKIDKEGNIHLSNDNTEGLKTVLRALREMSYADAGTAAHAAMERSLNR